MQISRTVDADSRWAKALDLLTTRSLLKVRHRTGRQRTSFTIEVPLENKEFIATYLHLVASWFLALKEGRRLWEVSVSHTQAFVEWSLELDALYSRFKRHTRLMKYPPHVVLVYANFGPMPVEPSEPDLQYSTVAGGEFQDKPPARDDAFVKALRLFGIEWGEGCIKVYTFINSDARFAHELLHAVEWAHGISRDYPENGAHEDIIVANAERVLGRDNPFVIEARRLVLGQMAA